MHKDAYGHLVVHFLLLAMHHELSLYSELWQTVVETKVPRTGSQGHGSKVIPQGALTLTVDQGRMLWRRLSMQTLLGALPRRKLGSETLSTR